MMTATELKKQLEAYKTRNGKWTFPAKRRRLFYDFKDMEEQIAIEHLNQKFEVFNFIYESLPTEEEKMFFKSDFKDHLELAKSKQKIEKYRLLIQRYLDGMDNPQQQDNSKAETETEITYNANEYALSYIFDTYANGDQIPVKRTEGGLDKKKIENIGTERGWTKKPDTFYRGVMKVLEYDLNDAKQLQNISNDWQNVISKLSINKEKTTEYLKDKNIIGE